MCNALLSFELDIILSAVFTEGNTTKILLTKNPVRFNYTHKGSWLLYEINNRTLSYLLLPRHYRRFPGSINALPKKLRRGKRSGPS